jgi:hypothetical protein
MLTCSFCCCYYIEVIAIIVIILQANALFEPLELKDSAQRKGHFALYNCLVLGHTMHNGVQRVRCIRGHARFSLVRTGFAPFLCLPTNRHRVQIV